MERKEEQAMEPFFNSPKQWHFEELRRETGISKPQLANWLKRFQEQGIIKKTKKKGKMPYYTQVFENKDYQNKKRIFALKKMSENGLLSHLSNLRKAKAIIVFGSYSRYDWHRNSDVDIFIYGNDEGFEQGKYELKLGREIQVHTAKNKKELKKINKVLPYIVEGYFVKGSMQDLGVEINVKVQNS